METPPFGSRRQGQIDQYIGKALQDYRLAAGMTIGQVADKTGLSHHQLQNYETGIARVSAHDLTCLCRTLDIPVTAIFPEPEPGKSTGNDADTLRAEAATLLQSLDDPASLEVAVTLLRLLARPRG